MKSVVLATIKNDVVAFRYSCQRKDVRNAGGMKPHPAVPSKKSNLVGGGNATSRVDLERHFDGLNVAK